MEELSIPRLEELSLELNDLKSGKERDYRTDFFLLKGLIKSFEMCFDLSWKVMKDIIRDYYGTNDYALGSPGENIRVAYRNGLIEDDATWLKLLRTRNRLVHDYDGEYAETVADEIVEEYTPFLVEFESRMYSFVNEHEEDIRKARESAGGYHV